MASNSSAQQQLSLSLICYDGSESAQQAIREVARVFPGSTALVLTVWHRYRKSGIIYPGWSDYIEDVETKMERESIRIVEEGTELAREVGLIARGESFRTELSVAEAIIERAAFGDCSIVVVGTVGHTAIGGSLMGSVSNSVLHHSTTPVLVVRHHAIHETETEREAAVELSE